MSFYCIIQISFQSFNSILQEEAGAYFCPTWVLTSFQEFTELQVGFPHSSVGKESACNAGGPGSIPGSRRSIGEEMTTTPIFLGFPGGSAGKDSAWDAGDLGSIPGLGRSPGGGHSNPHQYSCLENPRGQRNLVGRGPWGHKESDTTELGAAYT